MNYMWCVCVAFGGFSAKKRQLFHFVTSCVIELIFQMHKTDRFKLDILTKNIISYTKTVKNLEQKTYL